MRTVASETGASHRPFTDRASMASDVYLERCLGRAQRAGARSTLAHLLWLVALPPRASTPTTATRPAARAESVRAAGPATPTGSAKLPVASPTPHCLEPMGPRTDRDPGLARRQAACIRWRSGGTIIGPRRILRAHGTKAERTANMMAVT